MLALGLSLSSKEVGTYGLRTGPDMSLDLPVFNRNQGAISRAEAEVERAAWQYLAARDRVELEVREAWVLHIQALQSLERLRREILPTVRQNAEMAEKSYRSGDVSYLTVLEASRPLADVRLKEVEATAARGSTSRPRPTPIRGGGSTSGACRAIPRSSSGGCGQAPEW